MNDEYNWSGSKHSHQQVAFRKPEGKTKFKDIESVWETDKMIYRWRDNS